MALNLYNTLTRKKERFKPLNPEEVSIYNCGPTVYHYAHIGNFRAFICSDILKRYLIYKGFKVKQIMNITDVDDKTIRDSQKEKLSLKEFTKKYTQFFMEDLKTLNISPADKFPKATEHIKEMVKMIKILLEKDIAYETSDGIYFKIQKFKDYGKLANINLKQSKKGKRCTSDEYDKENAHDFALWKFWGKNDGDVFWETEIGKGRPGWHIECSAMSTKYLTESFDIHTGGIDLIFPHHENEIAQSEATTGKKFVKYWFHNEYIMVEGKKMSKSLGNFYTLRDLLKKGHNPKAIRYLLLSAHYKQQLNFTFEGIKAAENTVNKLTEFIDTIKRCKSNKPNPKILKLVEKTKKAFEKEMDDDLNISPALAHIFEFIHKINKINMKDELSKKDSKLILNFMKSIDRVIGVMEHKQEKIPTKITDLAKKREKARKNKDWKESDNIRDKIKSAGYEIKDTKEGFILKKI